MFRCVKSAVLLEQGLGVSLELVNDKTMGWDVGQLWRR